MENSTQIDAQIIGHLLKMYNRFCNCGKTKNPLVEQNGDTDMSLVPAVPAVSPEIQIAPLSVVVHRIY